MNSLETAKHAIDRLMQRGADKAQCKITVLEQHELEAETGDLNFLRTTFNTSLYLVGLMGGKKGATTINQTDPEAITRGVAEVIELAGSSRTDSANDIAGYQPPQDFCNGPMQPDRDTMYMRLREFLMYVQKTYPKLILRKVRLNFARSERTFVNSNGVEFSSKNGSYYVSVAFTSKDGAKTSSMNFVRCQCKDLNSAIKDMGGIDRLLGQSAQQLNGETVPQKFTGSLLITPECLSDFIGYFTRYISSGSMITGNSVYKDKLHQKIADSRLTLHSKPLSPELAATYFFTNDGYEAKDITIIENGILKSFLLNLYAANKTGRPRAENMGDCYIIEPGDTTLEEMIQSTSAGILLCRFSGGNPGENGDFSGVAKNSFYIADGKIQYPLTETMVAGNIVAMLNNIEQISKERNNDGDECLPWIKFGGISISGK